MHHWLRQTSHFSTWHNEGRELICPSLEYTLGCSGLAQNKPGYIFGLGQIIPEYIFGHRYDLSSNLCMYSQIWMSYYLATIDIPQVLINNASLNIAKLPILQYWKWLFLISLVKQIMYLFSEHRLYISDIRTFLLDDFHSRYVIYWLKEHLHIFLLERIFL